MILLRYNEIALKGGNRGYFETALASNIRALVKRELDSREAIEVVRLPGRLLLRAPWSPPVREALSRVFGLSSYSPVIEVETGLGPITERILLELALLLDKRAASGLPPKTFRVATRRTEKALPESSVEINTLLGGRIRERFPALEVELTDPDLVVGLEIRKERSFLWIEKDTGRGGLPVGTNGHFLSLLSGGIDSPVAAIQALKRGAHTSFVHFAGDPYIGPEGALKARELARAVNRFQPRPKPIYTVPFGKIQMRMALDSSARLRTVLYRRMMIRIAEALAGKVRAVALVTGESIGQVASQTISNLSIINQAARALPILRPLITFDKLEIVDLAKSLGTYETSIGQALDCCTLFADRHPSLQTTLEMVETEEDRLPIAELVEEGLAGVATFSLKRSGESIHDSASL